MTTFFFDCCDGERYLVDEYGIDLATEAEARDEAVGMLYSLLVGPFPDVEARTVTVSVRSSEGAPIYVARCDFTGSWTPDRVETLDRNGG